MRTPSFGWAAVLPLFLVSSAIQAEMVTSNPHPMMRGVAGVDFHVTIVGTGLEKTEEVWFYRIAAVGSWQAEIIGTPTDAELSIRLPGGLPLPAPGDVTEFKLCRYERDDAGNRIEECASVGVGGEQPTLPRLTRVQTIPLPGVVAFASCDNIVYARTYGTVYILDFADETAPELLATLTIGGELRGFVQNGTLLTTLRNGNELVLIDAQDPRNPFIRASLPLEGEAVGLDGNGRYQFVTLRTQGDLDELTDLAIVDVSAPNGPAVVNVVTDWEIGGGYYPGAPYVDHRFVFVTLSPGFLGAFWSTAIDMTNPLAPVVFSGAGPFGYGLKFYGDYAYGTGATDYSSGGHVDFGDYEISYTEVFYVSPRFELDPPILSSITTSRTGFAASIAVGGNYVFTSNGEIIDVRDPLRPVFGTILSESHGSVPFIRGNRLYYPGAEMAVYDASALPGFEAVVTPCRETPLLVVLEMLTAEAVAGGVRVRWRTESELNHAGFRVLRGDSEGTPSVVSPWIPGLGSELAGAEYEYLDRPGPSRRKLFYWLEDIDLTGRVTRHGPVTVDFGAPAFRSSRASNPR